MRYRGRKRQRRKVKIKHTRIHMWIVFYFRSFWITSYKNQHCLFVFRSQANRSKLRQLHYTCGIILEARLTHAVTWQPFEASPTPSCGVNLVARFKRAVTGQPVEASPTPLCGIDPEILKQEERDLNLFNYFSEEVYHFISIILFYNTFFSTHYIYIPYLPLLKTYNIYT